MMRAMKTTTLAVLCSVAVGSSAYGQTQEAGKAAATPPDMSKVGPWSRKVTNEKSIKKDVTEFYKQEDELMKKGDFDALFSRIDFPIYMVSDNAAGVTSSKEYSKEEYIAMMKPMWEQMPKDVKTTHKTNTTVLSDSIVLVVDDYSMKMGKEKFVGRNYGTLVKVAGAWKWKSMTEAGWGDVDASKSK